MNSKNRPIALATVATAIGAIGLLASISPLTRYVGYDPLALTSMAFGLMTVASVTVGFFPRYRPTVAIGYQIALLIGGLLLVTQIFWLTFMALAMGAYG